MFLNRNISVMTGIGWMLILYCKHKETGDIRSTNFIIFVNVLSLLYELFVFREPITLFHENLCFLTICYFQVFIQPLYHHDNEE